MAFGLTLLSLILAYFSPSELVPQLAPYHLQQFILFPAIATTLATMAMRQSKLQFPQSILIIGVWFGIVMSAMSKFWLRTSLEFFIAFSVVVCLYFLVLINSYSIARIRLLYLVLLLFGLIMAVQGILAYHAGYQKDKLVIESLIEGFVVMKRIRAYGFLSDPNDFAQFLLVALAALRFFWVKGRGITNIVVLIIPTSVLVYATYLTHSRGAIIGICVIAVVLISTRFGRIQSVVVAALLFLVMVAFKFGAGREIGVSEGSAAGRLMAWGTGIQMLRDNPLFGVGYGRFTEFHDLTAHNSFVLCFAELGIFGYFFWLALIITTVIGVERLARMGAATGEDEAFARALTATRAALYSFLATSLFLSRTYNVSLYVILAMAAALIQMRQQRHPELALKPARWIPLTVAGQFASLVLVYLAVRLRAL